MMFGHSNRSMFVLFLSPQSETPWGPSGLASAGILRPRFTLAAILGRISAWNLVWSHSMASPRSKNWGQTHWNVQLRSSMFWRGPKSCTASVTKPWFKFKGVRPKTAKEGTTGIVRRLFLVEWDGKVVQGQRGCCWKLWLSWSFAPLERLWSRGGKAVWPKHRGPVGLQDWPVLYFKIKPNHIQIRARLVLQIKRQLCLGSLILSQIECQTQTAARTLQMTTMPCNTYPSAAQPDVLVWAVLGTTNGTAWCLKPSHVLAWVIRWTPGFAGFIGGNLIN